MILTGTKADLVSLATARTNARMAGDTQKFDELTYMLGTIDRRKGSKGFNEETVVMQVAVELAQQFNNDAEKPEHQNQLDLISKLKSSSNFYKAMLPEQLTEQEITEAFVAAQAEGAKQIGQFTKFFEKHYFGRFERSVIVGRAQALLGK